MANTHIQRTTGTGDNRKKFTYSLWIKLADLTGENKVFIYGTSGTEGGININYPNDAKWNFYDYQSGGYTYQLVPNRLFRDTSAYYHVTVAVDTTQATSSNRVKIWINGVQETSFATANYPSQNADMACNNSNLFSLGNCPTQSNYFSGIVSHVHFSDGYAYQASDFGSTDATTGNWKIKTVPSISYGSQGFFILKDGNSLTDQSPNTNNFSTVSGTLTKSEDSPSNVFATLNPLSNNSGTFSNGNNSISGGNDTASTLGASAGKFYWEVKRTNTTTVFHAGICSSNQGFNGTAQQFLNGSGGSVGGSIFIRNDGSAGSATQASNSGFSSVSYNLNSFTVSNGDILGFALDLDSATKRLDIYKNGSSVGYVTFSYDGLNPIFAFSRMNSGATSAWNFGNGYFGTTAVSSAGTNASNLGIFEYNVPSGYTALCTKGLNE